MSSKYPQQKKSLIFPSSPKSHTSQPKPLKTKLKQKTKYPTKKIAHSFFLAFLSFLRFFQQLFYFIFSFFSKKFTKKILQNPNQKYSLLNSVHVKRQNISTLKSFQPSFYDYSIQKILPSFPQYIFSIYSEIQNLYLFFSDLPKKNIPRHLNQSFSIQFINHLIQNNQFQSLNFIDHEFFKSIASNFDYQKSLAILNKKLDQWILDTRSSSYDAICHYTSYFQKLINLLKFNFVQFFQLFDPHFDPQKKSYFQPIFGNNGAPQIAQLNSYLQTIRFQSIPENVLIHFSQISKITSKPSQYPLFDQKKCASLVQKIHELNSKKILESIIKLMTKNYHYSPFSVAQYPDSFFFDQYCYLISSYKKNEFKSVFQKNLLEMIQLKVINFFKIPNMDELPSIKLYNQETNSIIKNHSHHVDELAFVFIISIYRFFYQKIYQTKIEKILYVLLINSNFIDKNVRAAFMENFYRLNKLSKQLEQFVSDIDLEKSEYSHALLSLISNPKNPPSPLTALKLEKLELSIHSRLSQILDLYIQILQYVKKTTQDWKNPQPKLILDLEKDSKNFGYNHFIQFLIQSESSLTEFISIIQCFPSMNPNSMNPNSIDPNSIDPKNNQNDNPKTSSIE